MNLVGFICEAFGYNAGIYKDIDILYQKRKFEFYKLARDNEFYSHPLITEGSLLQEEYCKKALGIILYQFEHSDDTEVIADLDEILRKGWTYAYTYTNTHNKIDCHNFMERLIQKSGGLINLSDDDLNTNLIILITLAASKGKEIIENDFCMSFLETLQLRLLHYNEGDPTRISLKHCSDEQKKQIKEIKKKIYGKIGLVKDYASLLHCLNGKWEGEIFSFLFDFDNLTSSILWNIPWSDQDNDEIIYTYLVRNQGEDPALYYQAAMYIRYLIKAYKQVKTHYFANNKETQFAELEAKEKEIIRLISKLDQREAQVKDLIEQAEQLTKQVEKLQKEIESEQLKNNELNSLREFMFSLDTQVEYAEKDIDYNILKTIKAVIIGGHEKWQSRMKEILPGCIFIHTDMINFDMAVLDSVDIVFFYVNYLNHSIYYRIIERLRNTKKKIHYLNQQNESLVLKDIWRTYEKYT